MDDLAAPGWGGPSSRSPTGEASEDDLIRLIAIEINRLVMEDASYRRYRSTDPMDRRVYEANPKGQCIMATGLALMVYERFGFTVEPMPVRVDVIRETVEPPTNKISQAPGDLITEKVQPEMAAESSASLMATPADNHTKYANAEAMIQRAENRKNAVADLVQNAEGVFWQGHLVPLVNGMIVDPTAAQMADPSKGMFIPDSIIIPASDLTEAGTGEFHFCTPISPHREVITTLRYHKDPANVGYPRLQGWGNPSYAGAANRIIADVTRAAKSPITRAELHATSTTKNLKVSTNTSGHPQPMMRSASHVSGGNTTTLPKDSRSRQK